MASSPQVRHATCMRAPVHHCAVSERSERAGPHEPAHVRHVSARGYFGGEGNLRAVHASVLRRSRGQEPADTRVNAVRADEDVAGDGRPVGKCELVLAVTQRTD